jgi:hypothetical protein
MILSAGCADNCLTLTLPQAKAGAQALVELIVVRPAAIAPARIKTIKNMLPHEPIDK